jgi:translation initiation factor 2 subunit 1
LKFYEEAANLFLKRQGFPEEGEIVFCTVIKVQYHAITVQLDEYEDGTGLIPISEVSPGRIRNIRDFVEEGKKVVCKVIRVDIERGHVDLSLRRVNESQKRNKTDAIKQEQKAEKMIESFAEKVKKPVQEVYNEIAPIILNSYPWIYMAFEDVIEKNLSLEKVGLKSETASELEKFVREKIKPKKVEIIEKIAIKTFNENGLEMIKQSFARLKDIDSNIEISYLGGGNYRMHVTAKDYKKAENIIAEVKESMGKSFADKRGEITFTRQEA